MLNSPSPQLLNDLERHISARTGRRIRNLAIDVQPEQVILRGQTTSYYIKQLAQHGLREMLPHVHLANTIVVEENQS
jgi:hypothetical protein